MDVKLSRNVEKQLRSVPLHIVKKLQAWVDSVKHRGLKETKLVKGYHDEPLKGQKLGRRSIRLSKQWRAEYTYHNDKIEFVLVEEVHPHAYKK